MHPRNRECKLVLVCSGCRLIVSWVLPPHPSENRRWRPLTICLVLLACYGIFSKNDHLNSGRLRKTESGCKGNNFTTYLPNFHGTFFFKTPDPDGEPAGSSPKAGAKVQAFNVTAKHINHFFQEFNEVFYTCADIQMVTTERKRGRKRKEEKVYTI